MNSFDSLTLACEGCFDKPLCDLPDALRQRLEGEFWPMPWDKLSAKDRRSLTEQVDYKKDPATESVRQFAWYQSDRMILITTDIAKWGVIATPTALDLAQKEKRLTELREELARTEAEVFVAVGPIESLRNPAQPNKRKTGSGHQTSLADTTAVEKPRGSTVRRDARKLDTEALHKQWQKAYRVAKKTHPNMSDSWYSKHIAKMEIGIKRNSETIRKNMKS